MASIRPLLAPRALPRALPSTTRLSSTNKPANKPAWFEGPARKPEEKTKSAFNNLPGLPPRRASPVVIPNMDRRRRSAAETLEKHTSFAEIIRQERTKRPPTTSASSWSYLNMMTQEEPRLVIPPATKTGRTVHVKAQAGLERAFEMLDRSVAANKVRQISNLQRFHERGGLRRKRLHSQRWRMRFKKGFAATVSRVQELVRQGW